MVSPTTSSPRSNNATVSSVSSSTNTSPFTGHTPSPEEPCSLRDIERCTMDHLLALKRQPSLYTLSLHVHTADIALPKVLRMPPFAMLTSLSITLDRLDERAMLFLQNVIQASVRRLDLVVETCPLAARLQVLLSALAIWPRTKELRDLSLVFGDVPPGVEDVGAYAVTPGTLKALKDMRDLKTFHIDAPRILLGYDAQKDVDYLFMLADSLHHLESASLENRHWKAGRDRGERAGLPLSALRHFSSGRDFPALSTLSIELDASIEHLRRFGPTLSNSSGSSPLQVLKVGDAAIDSPSAVTHFLKTLFPGLCMVEHHSSRREWNDAWEEVNRLLTRPYEDHSHAKNEKDERWTRLREKALALKALLLQAAEVVDSQIEHENALWISNVLSTDIANRAQALSEDTQFYRRGP